MQLDYKSTRSRITYTPQGVQACISLDQAWSVLTKSKIWSEISKSINKQYKEIQWTPRCLIYSDATPAQLAESDMWLPPIHTSTDTYTDSTAVPDMQWCAIYLHSIIFFPQLMCIHTAWKLAHLSKILALHKNVFLQCVFLKWFTPV